MARTKEQLAAEPTVRVYIVESTQARGTDGVLVERVARTVHALPESEADAAVLANRAYYCDAEGRRTTREGQLTDAGGHTLLAPTK